MAQKFPVLHEHLECSVCYLKEEGINFNRRDPLWSGVSCWVSAGAGERTERTGKGWVGGMIKKEEEEERPEKELETTVFIFSDNWRTELTRVGQRISLNRSATFDATDQGVFAECLS